MNTSNDINRGVDATKLDKNMAFETSNSDNLKWLDPWESPIYLAGFPWFSKDKVFCRLPIEPTHPVREPVEALSYCTAGGQIHFRTDSTRLELDVELSAPANMYHMPATGQCGFDCYISTPSGEIKYYSTTRYDHTEADYRSALYEDLEPKMRDVVINFPLYQGVERVKIGLDIDSKIEAPTPFTTDKKAIFYGTSITQGGCASRPGMVYTNILSRWLNLECVNLGFSGNGRGEPELAKLIGEIEDPACLVIDYDGNCPSAEHIQDTLPNFIDIYRSVYSHVPIVVISRIRYAKYAHSEEVRQERRRRRDVQYKIVNEFKDKGDDNIFFIDGVTLLGEHFEEMTVDGVHPTDLGFLKMAEGLSPILKTILML